MNPDAIPEDLRIKSILILGGDVKVPEGFSHPYAEPKGDGTGRFTMSFGDTRIAKRYSPDEGEFELVPDGEGYRILRDGVPLIDGVGLVEKHCHSPYQANVRVDPSVSDEEMMDRLQALVDTGTVHGISVGAVKDASLEDCVRSIRSMRDAHPDLPIGLSWRPCPVEDLKRLKDAGLDEFRLNIHSTVPRISGFLGEKDGLEDMLRCLSDAVRVFGRGRVSTGLYAGLGETDGEIEGTMREMAGLGVVCDLKYRRIKPAERERAEEMLGCISETDPERFAALGMRLKEIESEYGLDSRTCRTLCIACRGCNLVPFLDYRGYWHVFAGTDMDGEAVRATIRCPSSTG